MRIEQLQYRERTDFFSRLHNFLNRKLFNSELKDIFIDVQNLNKDECDYNEENEEIALGVFSIESITQREVIAFSHEFMDSIGRLENESEQLEEVSVVLLHEMIHQYCYENGIDDSGHNDNFQGIAFQHGLDSMYVDGIKVYEDFFMVHILQDFEI